MAAAVVLDTQKTVFEQAGLEVVLELLAHQGGKTSTIDLEGRNKDRVILLDELIPYRLFQPVAALGGGWGRRCQ